MIVAVFILNKLRDTISNSSKLFILCFLHCDRNMIQ